VPVSPHRLHKAASYLPLLEAIGGQGEARSCDYTVQEEERQAARVLLEAHGAGNGRPCVILHPGANWSHKRWAPERFAALGDRLAERHAVHVVITGGPDDQGLVEQVARTMHQPAIVLAGRTTLRQFGGCVAQANLVIANDTGVLHLAAALSRPLIALYGPTSPALTGPLGDAQRIVVIHHPDCCPRVPCTRPAQGADHPGMDAITVEEVYAAASAMLTRFV
jgi:lipopolysaccharide heptosyltransferase II